jgi:hypothetical protein
VNLAHVLFVTLNACDVSPRQPNPKPSPVSPDTVVVVGHRSLAARTLALLQVRAQVQSTEFVKNWATDSLLAESARAGALHASRVRQVERGVLARGLLESIYQKARELGQPTERELQELTSERWTEFDRPAAAQTTHFVVRTTEGQPTTSAELLARRLAIVVHGCKTAEEFRMAVEAFPKENGLQVVVESLPPVTKDGRSLRMGSDDQVLGAGPSFDLKFAQVANSLAGEGEQSEVVHTSFGFHVIRLDRKIHPQQASIETRREKLTDDVYLRRARHETDRCIQDSRQRHQIRIETSFQEVVAQLQAAQ